MSEYDHDYIMTERLFRKVLRRYGIKALTCPKCKRETSIGQRIFSKAKAKNVRRHYDCAVKVNMVEA